MGVQFFGGKFYKCVDESGLILPAKIIQDRNSCISANHYWMNSNANFDNALNGFLALLQVVSQWFIHSYFIYLLTISLGEQITISHA